MDERAGNDGRLPSHSRTVGIVGLPPHARCCRRLIALSLRHLQLPDDQPSHSDLRQGDGKMAFALFGTGLLMELIGLMELKIDQLNKVNYGNAIPILSLFALGSFSSAGVLYVNAPPLQGFRSSPAAILRWSHPLPRHIFQRAFPAAWRSRIRRSGSQGRAAYRR